MRFLFLVAGMAAGMASSPPNVLMIISDDLRPQIDATGFNFPRMHTPNLKALSHESLAFTRCYVQQALCAPSRNSFLSGRRPTKTMSWNFIDDFRRSAPGGQNWTALPQYFRERGYYTVGAGKVYHPGLPQGWDFPKSWSNRHINKTVTKHHNGTATNVTEKAFDWLYPSEAKCPGNTSWCAIEPHDTNNTDFDDRQILNASLHLLRTAALQRKRRDRPFFLAVGFRKPHLQWKFPARFLNLSYGPALADVPLPKNRFFPTGAPPVAFHQPKSDFMDAFNDTRKCGSKHVAPHWAFSKPCQRLFRRAYWAAVSYLDSQVGLLLAELRRQGQDDNTIVVFFGDHGWQLGEYAEWEKFTNFEAATRTPLMIKVPWLHSTLRNRSTRALVELVDVMPTLIDLVNGTVPAGEELDGTSLRPLLEGTAAERTTQGC